MDEKELYLRDNIASRTELNEAIVNYALSVAMYEQSRIVAETVEGCCTSLHEERFAKVNRLLDVLYARLYLAECPF